jgi:ectoine hydroxylase-related dioxygenase (phytanoyl-CoA dioxygenase family)
MLNQPFQVTADHIQHYARNGFVKIKNVLPPDVIHYMCETISSEVKRLNTQHLPIEQRDTYGKAFLQVMNIWTRSELVKEIIFSKRLAKMAADIMQVEGVRMYHDQALFKEPGGGHTPWHADQYYWPLNSDKTVTVWIPLQKTDLEMGPLEFSSGSQQLLEGRNLKISDESENEIQRKLTLRDFEQVIEPFEVGEVSFHMGWVFHRAGANKTDRMRRVMTNIYMDKNIRLSEPANDNQVADWNTWCPGVKVGAIVDSPLNPILYSK